MSTPAPKSQTPASSIDDIDDESSANQVRADTGNTEKTPAARQGATENSVTPVQPPTNDSSSTSSAEDEIDPEDEITPG